ncbi:hypothetical protein P3471_14340 [Vibrio parahaemolyticus]|nr:hypothetical protein [Vibrio parahaemolyticus]
MQRKFNAACWEKQSQLVRRNIMADKDFKEPYNIFYFLGFIAVLLIPTLPATLTWLRVMNGYAGF